MRDHLLKERENKWTCIYCNQGLGKNNWGSEWEGEQHYKTTKCSCCGRKIRIKVDFCGTGHDDWHEQESWVFDKGKMKDEKSDFDKKIEEEHRKIDST